VRYGLIESMRRRYPIALMCRVFDVSESGFHARKARPPCDRERENARLEIEILAAHRRTRETYSAMRLHRDLVDHGIQCTLYRVRTLRKKLGLCCKQKLKFKVTTNSKHNLPVAPNIIEREFSVSTPNKVWVSDITYIPTDEGWLYLAESARLFRRLFCLSQAASADSPSWR
jgi:putative transposase